MKTNYRLRVSALFGSVIAYSATTLLAGCGGAKENGESAATAEALLPTSDPPDGYFFRSRGGPAISTRGSSTLDIFFDDAGEILQRSYDPGG